MTPMIDVVFLLLIYFVMTMQPLDIFAHLEVYAPSSDAPPREQPRDPPSLIRIGVYSDGFTFDESVVTLEQVDRYLSMLASASATQSVIILCATNSYHGNLVQVLNICAKYGLTNLSVVSAN
jgi:biopolymer transport protein ExbD